MGTYDLGSVYTAIRNPKKAGRYLNRFLNAKLLEQKYGTGFDVLAEDWDNLIILDGCRYDIFDQYNTFEGTTTPITSKGAHSFEFMKNTFDGKQLHDTAYVTANPWSEELPDDTFFLTRRTYTDRNKGGEARLPEDVADLSIKTFEEYPNKRYIVHFMQPNNPYVGPKAEQLRADLLADQNVLCTELHTPDESDRSNVVDEVPNLRRALKKGYITQDQMFEVYIENLGIVTDHAKRVIDELDGKTAITADHGDMFGERLAPLYIREYSHWENVYSKQLRTVPWHVQESETRREIETGRPQGKESMNESDVEEHLKSMGYLQ